MLSYYFTNNKEFPFQLACDLCSNHSPDEECHCWFVRFDDILLGLSPNVKSRLVSSDNAPDGAVPIHYHFIFWVKRNAFKKVTKCLEPFPLYWLWNISNVKLYGFREGFPVAIFQNRHFRFKNYPVWVPMVTLHPNRLDGMNCARNIY